jgi:hypothetical protein
MSDDMRRRKRRAAENEQIQVDGKDFASSGGNRKERLRGLSEGGREDPARMREGVSGCCSVRGETLE